MRINARLDKKSEEQLRYLQEHTGKNLSEIIKESLAYYCQMVAADAQQKNQQLLKELSGIGGSGSSDGSVNYKRYVNDYVDAKHRHR